MNSRIFSMSVLALVVGACASNRQFTEGEYDDVSKVRHLDDKFNESDAVELMDEMVVSMAEHPVFKDARVAPVVQIERVRNKTSEHIDTKSMTDSLRTALIKTGRARFSNKEDRELLHEEQDFQNESGRTRRDTQKRRDGGIGADYVLTGELVSNVQQVGDRKLVFYKLNLILTNITTGLIEWSDEKPIRKKFRKKSVGL